MPIAQILDLKSVTIIEETKSWDFRPQQGKSAAMNYDFSTKGSSDFGV